MSVGLELEYRLITSPTILVALHRGIGDRGKDRLSTAPCDGGGGRNEWNRAWKGEWCESSAVVECVNGDCRQDT